MTAPPNYIDLRRRFATVPQEAGTEESALRSYSLNWAWRHGSLAWDELLQHNLVVVLGEPGSGKTYELQNQATLSSPDGSRFYYRLDELAEGSAQFQHAGTTVTRIAEWRKSGVRGVFFLDSVDEAKLRQPTDFYRALDVFVELIGHGALARATIVISSRITEWLPTTDGHEVRIRFPRQSLASGKSPPKRKTEEPTPFVVQLLPLDQAAVKTYATARGVTDAQRFLEELERAHAWELARRPADVDDLLAFWRESGTLGTLTEILAFACENQLKKTSDRERREELALQRAQSGAECLAAATILCRKFVFRIPGETPSASKGLDALACLPPDWRNEEARALLNHALFDGASYGHIRFHHRRLSEFLAWRWIENLMAQGCPVGHLEELLFDARGSNHVLRPSLAPIAAWLCGGASRWNVAVRRRTIEVAPEILLRYGDPATLPIEDRRALLAALLRKAGGRNHLWWEHEEATLSRLADPNLAPEINSLITAPESGRTLREIGLEMVIAGRLIECAPAVLTAAIPDLEKGEVFPVAARALKLVGSESDLEALAVASQDIAVFPTRVGIPLSELLFPKIWSVAEFFQILARTKSSGQGWDYNLAAHLVPVVNRENALELLKGFLGKPIPNEGDEDEFEPPPNVRLALAVASVMLDWSSLSEEEASHVATALLQAGGRRSYVTREESLPERTERHSNVRERYFLLASEEVSRKHAVADERLFAVLIYYDWIPIRPSDLAWILSLLERATSSRERERFFYWALDAWRHTGRSRTDFARIKKIARSFPDTRKLFWESFHPGIVARFKAVWYQRFRYRFFRHQWRMHWREIVKTYFGLRNRLRLWRYRNKMRSGELAGLLGHLVTQVQRESTDQYTFTDWSELEKSRGMACAKSVKAGCMRAWLLNEPPLPHQKKPTEGTAYSTIAGLAGIATAWREGSLDFRKLSLDEAKRATRYALSELNGFPIWFDDLIKAEPEAVRSVLFDCVACEWEVPADAQYHSLLINRLAWSNSAAVNLIKPIILRRLEDDEPKNTAVLRDAVRIVTTPPSPLAVTLANLASHHGTTTFVSAPIFPLWMALWLQADAHAAIIALESKLGATTDAAQVMAAVCANLDNRHERIPLLEDPSWLTPASMRKFIPLVYRYIRREDDIDRSGGGAYSPTARDEAQDFRGGLLERLVARKNPEVEPVLQELLHEPLLAHLSDYIRHLLEKNREQLADGPAWRATDVRRFALDYEREPQTDADLFRMGIRRLLDLKRWVEIGEDSPRQEVHPEDKEAGFRDWLRRRLNENSRGYVVPPEWQIVGGRPDLRLAMAGAAPVSIELKIADNWTLQQLLDGLETQLVNTYLRDDRARYGIYVLAVFSRGRKWEPLECGPRVDVQQMFALLQNRASQIVDARLDIAGLEIVLIDFSPPPTS